MDLTAYTGTNPFRELSFWPKRLKGLGTDFGAAAPSIAKVHDRQRGFNPIARFLGLLWVHHVVVQNAVFKVEER
jgi:hypothetical protein